MTTGFTFHSFEDTSFPLLGSGVWGAVYDLGDETVIKLAKKSGGIGDGHQKIAHEIEILKSLGHSSVPVPRFIEQGDIPQNSEFYAQGYSIWSRISKIKGTIFTVRQIEDLPELIRKTIAQSLAKALWQFHESLRAANITKNLKIDGIFDCLDEADYNLTSEDRKRAEKVLSLFDYQTLNDLVPIHGDFNISNILFDENLNVSGVLDFAEVCLGTIEDDISSLTSELPFLKESIVMAYESHVSDRLDQKRLVLAEIKRDLIGMLICRYRLGRSEEAYECQKRLDQAVTMF